MTTKAAGAGHPVATGAAAGRRAASVLPAATSEVATATARGHPARSVVAPFARHMVMRRAARVAMTGPGASVLAGRDPANANLATSAPTEQSPAAASARMAIARAARLIAAKVRHAASAAIVRNSIGQGLIGRGLSDPDTIEQGRIVRRDRPKAIAGHGNLIVRSSIARAASTRAATGHAVNVHSGTARAAIGRATTVLTAIAHVATARVTDRAVSARSGTVHAATVPTVIARVAIAPPTSGHATTSVHASRGIVAIGRQAIGRARSVAATTGLRAAVMPGAITHATTIPISHQSVAMTGEAARPVKQLRVNISSVRRSAAAVPIANASRFRETTASAGTPHRRHRKSPANASPS